LASIQTLELQERPRKKKIALGLQLLTPKVGGLITIFLPQPFLELQSFKRGQGKYFCLNRAPKKPKKLQAKKTTKKKKKKKKQRNIKHTT
jgi:hypothetical protein